MPGTTVGAGDTMNNTDRSHPHGATLVENRDHKQISIYYMMETNQIR